MGSLIVGANVVAGVVQPLGDRAVERRADNRVSALRLDRRRAPLSRRRIGFSRGELAIGIVQLAARCRALVDEHRMRPCASCACFTRSSAAFHRRFVDGGLRAERRKLEPHEHLAALHRVADVLRDFGNARRLSGDDRERRARQRGDDAGRADRRADGSEPDGLGDDRNGRLRFGFARRGATAGGKARRAREGDDRAACTAPDFTGPRAFWKGRPSVPRRGSDSRKMAFREVVGHRRLLSLLSQAIARQSLTPSLILSGPEGVGKRLTAISIAQELNCLSHMDRWRRLRHRARCAAALRAARIPT